VKVFPVPETEEKSLKFSTFEVMTAGIYIGNFRILHEFRGNDKAMAPNIQKRNDCLMSAMENAVASNDLQKVKHLLQLGIDPNGFVSRDFSVLGHAARCYFAGKSYGYHVGVDMFRILLDHGADPNQKYGTLRDITPFWWLVESETFYGSYIRNDPEAANMMPVLRLMLEKGADPNVTCGSFGSQTAFECVVRAHQTRTKQTHLPLVKLLVEGGGKITPELLKDADEPTRAYLQSVLDGKVKVNRIVLDTKPASAPSRACQ